LPSRRLTAAQRSPAACTTRGEGGLAPAHRQGGELVLQIGTGYFGCRDAAGRFALDQLLERVGEAPVQAIEIKLSQGAKPGLGGLLPAPKVTEEIARIRGVPAYRDCASPASHSAFSNDELIEFVERIADATGLPVGIKSAVGDLGFWVRLAERMAATGAGPDFLTVDGGEGGTGAAPLTFSDHVALPFKLGMASVFPLFVRAGIAEDVVFIGGGRLGFPDAALHALALGCDMVNVGREAMLAIGCIQALRCHTGRCPTGIATQSRWLMRGLDPNLKFVRAANYIVALRAELLSLARACGARHPALIEPDRIEIVSERYGSAPLSEVFGYERGWPLLSPERRAETEALIGAPAPRPAPGPQAGEHAGFPGAGDPARRHMDAHGVGERAGEGG
jgi:glutamate synthase domain-containing protein 2